MVCVSSRAHIQAGLSGVVLLQAASPGELDRRVALLSVSPFFKFLKEQYLLRDPLPRLLAECFESKQKLGESLQVLSGIWQGICST